MEATSYGMRPGCLTSSLKVSEFDKLRDVLAKAKKDGFEVTIDGQIKGYDYFHTPKREYSQLLPYEIEQKLELIKAGTLKPLKLPVLARREESLEKKIDVPLPSKVDVRNRVIGVVLAGSGIATLVYTLSSYLQ